MMTLEWKRYKNLISHSRDLEDFRGFDFFLVDRLSMFFSMSSILKFC